MREAPPPHSIILIPMGSITNRLEPRNECVVRLYRSLNAIIVGLAKTNALHQLPADVLHGSSLFEIDRLCAFIWDNVEDTSFAWHCGNCCGMGFICSCFAPRAR